MFVQCVFCRNPIGVVEQRQFSLGAFRHAGFKMFATNGRISFIATNLNLIPVLDDSTVGGDPENHCCFATAMTDGLNLTQGIGPSQ